MSDKDKTRPRGRPKASGIRKLSKSVTVKFSRIDYERLLHRSRQANRTLAEFIREAAFEARIVARHSTEEAAVIRNLVGMANNLNQLARLSHQTGFYRTRNAVMEQLEKLKVIMNEYKKWKGEIHDRQNQERQILGGCIRYVMGKDNAEIIGSDGVLLGNNREIADSFNCQCLLNPKIKQPVGHIALSFKPEDKPVLSNEFMAKIAMEYMDLMGIRNTQFILVRHHHTDNPHCHLVYNRIGYDGKVISSQGDYKRNEMSPQDLKTSTD